jgi:methanogenic corrinoid protein MtbC1
MSNNVDKFEEALLALDRIAIKEMIKPPQKGLEAMHHAEELVIPALERIGEKWESGKIALSQVYMGGKICEDAMDNLLATHAVAARKTPKMAIAVLEDHHLLGKRIVVSTLRAAGYDLDDYGRIEADDLIARARADDVRILLISTLMLPSALRIRKVRDALDPDVKIVVGGAPFRLDPSLWEEVKADAMCRTASDALPLLAELTNGDRS